MIKKLRIKFIIVAMVVTAFVLYTIIGIVNIRNYVNIVDNADQTLTFLVEGGGRFPFDNAQPPETQGNVDKKRPNGISPEMPFETRYFTVKLDSTGEVVSVDMDKIAAVNETTATTYAKEIFGSGTTKGFKGNYRYALSSSDGVTNVIFVDCTHDLETFYSFLQASMLISLAGLVIVFILILFFSRLIVKPVAETYQKQKQFITDANHELKTPLTVIGANCDLLEMESGENEWTHSIRNQVDKLTELTNKLVFLSRMDEENTNTIMTDFSLSEIASDTASAYSALALSQNKKFEADIAENVTVHGDIALIRELLTLLLDNAFKYSSGDGDIKLTVSTVGKNKVIKLSNMTDGVPQGILNKLFERFYRLDKSRNSQTGGHGIGLSVAKAITELHKGKITASSADGYTIVFTVTLP